TTTGRIPGTGRTLAATAAALMGAVPVTHLLTDVMGRVPASYTAVGMATAVMVAGARYTLRADVDNHPPVVAADEAPAERITATENYEEALS
ncbi:MAG: hypothetical protein QG597_3309, partial [Actinomycetota bacterium]|nr:hypothetical protein [Actinomycetota bacterium]